MINGKSNSLDYCSNRLVYRLFLPFCFTFMTFLRVVRACKVRMYVKYIATKRLNNSKCYIIFLIIILHIII